MSRAEQTEQTEQSRAVQDGTLRVGVLHCYPRTSSPSTVHVLVAATGVFCRLLLE